MKKIPTIVASALLVGGLSYLAFVARNQSANNAISTAPATEVGTKDGSSGTGIANPMPPATEGSKTSAPAGPIDGGQTRPDQTAIDVTSIKSYAEILKDISHTYWRTSDGLSLRRKARFSCLFSYQGDMKLQEKNPDIFKQDKSRLLSIAFLEKFCGDSQIESREAIEADSEMLPHSDDVYRASGLIELAETDRDLALTLALDLISRSKSGEAIEMAMDFLHHQKFGVGLGHENFSGGDAGLSLLRAQKVAAQMVSCDYSRMCGPDSLRAWVECVQPGVCQPGVSMQLIWQRSNSPQIYEGAVAIANQLRAMRKES